MLGSLFQVCEVDFADTGKAAKSQQGQFDASFSCQDCKAPPPATPAPTAPVAPPNPSDARKYADRTMNCFNQPSCGVAARAACGQTAAGLLLCFMIFLECQGRP